MTTRTTLALLVALGLAGTAHAQTVSGAVQGTTDATEAAGEAATDLTADGATLICAGDGEELSVLLDGGSCTVDGAAGSLATDGGTRVCSLANPDATLAIAADGAFTYELASGSVSGTCTAG